MKKLTLICVLIILFSSVYSVQLVTSSTDTILFLKASQNETWLIRYNASGGTIYDENFDPLCTFTFNETGSKRILQVGRDFDNDNNIEILYCQQNGDIISTYLKDLTTGDYDLALIGSTGSAYLCNSSDQYSCEARYLNSERVFIITNYRSAPNPVQNIQMLYSSGVIAPPGNVSLFIDDDGVHLSWEPSLTGTEYYIYSTSDLSTNIWTLETEIPVNCTSWTGDSSMHRKFFKITAAR